MILEISLFSAFNIIAAVIYASIEEYKKIEEDDADESAQQRTAPRNQLFSVNRIPSLSVADTVNV